MNMMQRVGLLALIALGACRGEEPIVKRNPAVTVKSTCFIDNHTAGNGTSLFTQAIDTTGDGRFDEVFVIRGYSPSRDYESNNATARATTHYVAPSIVPDQQLLTGFPDARAMPPDYQAALQLVCRGQ